MCDLPKNFFETATKENVRTYQRKSKCGRKTVLTELLMLFNYWSDQVEKLAHMIEITAIYV